MSCLLVVAFAFHAEASLDAPETDRIGNEDVLEKASVELEYEYVF